MIYYKVKVNDSIIDALDNVQCVRYSERSRMPLLCDWEDNPHGIVSSNGSKIWHVEGWAEFPDGAPNYSSVKLEEIDEQTFNSLRAELDAGQSLTESEEESIEMPVTEEVISGIDVEAEIIRLRSEVETLKLGPIQDEATTRFYQTLSDSSTNSIAKIRAAAQQYLDDTTSADN